MATLRGRSGRSFYYEEQSEIWFRDSDYRALPDAEFALLSVVDGVSYRCEVKSQKESFKAGEEAKLLKVAEAIRPDVLLIAVMDEFKTKEQVRTALEPKLRDLNVKLELWSLKDCPLNGSPYLR